MYSQFDRPRCAWNRLRLAPVLLGFMLVLTMDSVALAQEIAVSPESDSRGFLGPFAGLFGFAVLVWRIVFVAKRVAKQREERDERAWREQAAAARAWDRPAWLPRDDSPSARPAWIQGDAESDPAKRPAWMPD